MGFSALTVCVFVFTFLVSAQARAQEISSAGSSAALSVNPNPSSSLSPSSNVTSDSNITLIQGISTPILSLDPFSIAGIDAYTVTGNIIEPLARSNPRTGQIKPVLAKAWALDPKNKTFRVKLRDNVRFHNGEELTAEDVRFTWQAYFDPKFKGQIWQGMWSEIESVKVIDKLTVDFKMKNWRYQTFETTLTSLRILPKSFYASADKKKFREHIVGTGPFRQKAFKVNRPLEIEPFENWWGTKKPKHSVLFKHVATVKSATELMAKGQLDFYPLGEAKAPDSKYLRSFESGLGSGLWIDLNMSLPLFQDSTTRKVLELCWDREKTNQKIFAGKMELALDIFSPRTDVHPLSPTKAENREAAIGLLESNQWQDKDQDGTVEKHNVKFDFTVLAKSAEQERWLTFFQNDLKECGVRVRLQRVADDEQWLKRLNEGRFEAFAGGGGLVNEPTSFSWSTKGPYNIQKFSDTEVDQWTEQLEHEFDLQKRRLILRKVIARIRLVKPFVSGLITRYEHFFVSPRLKPEPTAPTEAWSWKLN